MATDLRHGFSLGDWRVWPLEGVIRRDRGEEVRLQPKAMDVLVRLAESGGVVVERDDLLASVWGERAVSDEPLTRCIGELRKAFGDSRADPKVILTVPKRGYRLLVAPTELNIGQQAGEVPSTPTLPRRTPLLTPGGLAMGLGTIALAAVVLILVERSFDEPDSPSVDTQVATESARSIAVLPFADMTDQQDHGYLADGIAEELIHLFAQNPALSVVARTSSFQFRDASVPATEIGRLLDVGHLIEGSVRRSGDQVRIVANLVDTQNGRNLWAESFDDGIGDVFGIQERIARRLAATLEISVLGDQLATRRTDPETYSLFLQARFAARKGARESLEAAIDLLGEAVSIDPGYAPAWALMAGVYNNLAGQGSIDWDQGFESSRESARRAVAEDPGFGGGHAELAWVAHRHDGDLEAAFMHMRDALQASPNDIEILSDAAVLFMQVDKLERAIRLLRYCIRRSPMDPRLRFNLGIAYKYSNRLAEALQIFAALETSNPDYRGVPYQLAEITFFQRDLETSLARWEALEGFNRLKGIAATAFQLGDIERSDAALRELIEHWGDKWPGVVADVYASRGDLDAAFEWLDRDYKKFGAAGWGEVRLQLWYDPLRQDARWAAFLNRVGIDPARLENLELPDNIPSSP